MKNRVLRADVATAAALAALVLFLAPGLAVVAIVAIAGLLGSLVTGHRDAAARRRGQPDRALRRHRGRRSVSARRPARR